MSCGDTKFKKLCYILGCLDVTSKPDKYFEIVLNDNSTCKCVQFESSKMCDETETRKILFAFY